MPPSVAHSQLPKVHAHAIKEPPGKAEVGAFLDGCCTNSTQPIPRFSRKHLFIQKILTSSRGGPRLLCAVQPDALFVRNLAPSSNRATDSRRNRATGRSPAPPFPPKMCRRLELRARRTRLDGLPESTDRSAAVGSNRVHNRFVNTRADNLPLAARRRVGHIGRTGDVAEWLKAAVC
jgi:hypothetical protein